MIMMEKGEIKTTILDKGVGPANCSVYQDENHTLILSSNHTQNHAAVYSIKE